MYFDYLRSADARPLKGVFYHNAMDVVSLAALFQHTAALLADPLNQPLEHGEDIIALAKLFEDLGQIDTATGLYFRGLDRELSEPALIQALQRLAIIHKRQDQLDIAIQLFEKAAKLQVLDAYVELAKLYEHRLRDYDRAIFWTQTALAVLPVVCSTNFERQQWQTDLDHRLERLVSRHK